jgi:effector-binding domain-containing protein
MAGYEVRVEERAGRPTAVIRADVPYEDLSTFLSGAFASVTGTVAEQGASVTGPPFGRYTPTERGFEVTAGFPVDRPVQARGRVVPDELPAGAVAVTLHTGPYSDVGEAYRAVLQWLSAHRMAVAGEAWETYLDGPDVAAPRTEVCLPCTRAAAPEA